MHTNGQIGFVTDYTLLNSLIKVDALIPFLVKNKLTYAGVVDNNLSSSIEFYYECKKNDIKPVIGFSIHYNGFVIYLYAKDYSGFKNLLKIHSYKEEISLDVLQKHHKNIICVIPNQSYSILEELSFFEDVFLSYANNQEKTEALLNTDRIVYLKEIRCYEKAENAYLKYLNMLGGENRVNYPYEYQALNPDDQKKVNELVSLIDINIPVDRRYIPVYKKDVNSLKFLSTLAHEGLRKRIGNYSSLYEQRLKYELSIIDQMGFVDYFLIVYDYCLYAKRHGCMVGPGRGSAAGSLVCYAIGITDIDPLKYNLMFERFLNPARITMPDIDIDFENTKRELIINYVKEKYGLDKVALGLTFNTLKAKLVLREVCKLLKVEENLINKFVKCIDAKYDLTENKKNERVKKFLELYSELDQAYKIALRLEGLKKNVSTHAAGVVISSVPLDDVIPIIKDNNNLLTGITMGYLENLGLLKMDFLGLKNLTIISNIIRQINISLKDIDLNDSKVLELFREGKTNGIFQYETYAMKSLLQKLKPASFNDLIAAVALVRPGPASYLEDYISVKENKKKISYLHPCLENILKETNGIILYQEQIISILEIMGGFSKSEADIIRRAISKKKEEAILQYKEKFIKGAIKQNIKEEIANKVYEMVIKFSGYGFNKSHSVAYALIGYQMAYLKCYYPMYFINELLKNNKDVNEINDYLLELKQCNVRIQKPDINLSHEDFYVLKDTLVLPLNMIKGITNEVAIQIIRNAPYKDFIEFASKNIDNISLEIVSTLIKAGALNSLHETEQTLINNLEAVFNYAELKLDDESLRPIINIYPEYEEEVISQNEFNLFGFYVGNHPASKYQNGVCKLKDAADYLFKNIKLIVLVENINRIKTKKGDDMAFIKVSDETGKMELVCFKNCIDQLKKIEKNKLVLVDGKVSKSFDKIRIIINNIISKK